MDEKLDKKIQTLAQWLYESRYPVMFTGAGISTESGLPDFRGPDGVWTRRDKGVGSNFRVPDLNRKKFSVGPDI